MNIGKIKLHFSFLIYLIIALYSGFIKEASLLFFCLLFHEAGHLIIILLTHNEIKYLHLTGFGFFIDLSNKRRSWLEKILIYSGGLIFSSFLQLIFLINNNIFLLKINLFIIILNVLPIIPLDGYNIIYTIFSLVWEDEYLNYVLLLIQVLLISLLFIIFLIFKVWMILVLIIFLSFKALNNYYCFIKYNKIIKKFKFNKANYEL